MNKSELLQQPILPENSADHLKQQENLWLPGSFHSIFARAIERYKYNSGQGLNEEEQISLNKTFVGYIFENLSFQWLKSRLNPGEILSSPEQTIRIYHLLYPNKKIIRDKFRFRKMIEGVSVPDGLVLKPSDNKKETAITGICEYTSSHVERFPEKFSQIINAQLNAQTAFRPLLDPDDQRTKKVQKYVNRKMHLPKKVIANSQELSLHFVLPSDHPFDESIIKDNVDPLPLSSKAFAKLINFLLLVAENPELLQEETISVENRTLIFSSSQVCDLTN